MKHRLKSNSHCLLIIIGIVLLTWLIFLAGWEEVKEVLARSHPLTLWFLFLLQLITLYLTGYMWYLLVKKFSHEPGLGTVMQVHLAGKFVESVTPAVKVGGEAAKVFWMRQTSSLTYQQLTATTIVSKYFSLMPFLLISLGVIIYTLAAWSFPGIMYLAFGGILVILALFLLFFKLEGITSRLNFKPVADEAGSPSFSSGSLKMGMKKQMGKILNFLKEASRLSNSLIQPAERWKLLGIGFMVWLLYPVKVFLVAEMLGYTPPFSMVVVATFIAFIASMFPLLPGGLGSFEGSMALIFTYVDLTLAEGLSIALVTRFITFWAPLLWCAVAAILVVYRNERKQKGRRSSSPGKYTDTATREGTNLSFSGVLVPGSQVPGEPGKENSQEVK